MASTDVSAQVGRSVTSYINHTHKDRSKRINKKRLHSRLASYRDV